MKCNTLLLMVVIPAVVTACAEPKPEYVPDTPGQIITAVVKKAVAPDELLIELKNGKEIRLHLTGLKPPSRDLWIYQRALFFLELVEGREITLANDTWGARPGAFVLYRAPMDQCQAYKKRTEYTRNLNVDMLRYGYCRMSSSGAPSEYAAKMLAAEDHARERRVGIWQWPPVKK